MALLIAPYNNGMRIGQGFNSYTQQICIDDAVVIDPDRPEVVVTNDGTTMRMLAEAAGRPSAWTRSDPVVSPPAQQQTSVGEETIGTSQKDVGAISNVENAIGAGVSAAVGDAASKYQDAYTDKQMGKMRGPEVDFDNKRGGLGKNTNTFELTDYGTKGLSQTVVYTSRFVERLSEITDDMNITGAISIKSSLLGGSGRGAFIDTNKFEQSDLNFYISVKVINQSVNFKDALKYQPLDSVDSSNFTDVYGDTFISGFLEGGEFNALVSMKILNSAKKEVIAAEAKVALSVPVIQVTAEGRVNIAKSNVNTNAETTIQVSWSGGGHIKDANEQWDVDSLIRAAARFPDLVAHSPQRIYAILFRYESLRSFLSLKPPHTAPLDYENAKLYTNSLMDSYMTYKSMYQECCTAIFDVQSGVKRFKPAIAGESQNTAPEDSEGFDVTPYPPTLLGLDRARREIRRQMSLITEEVNKLTITPALASDAARREPNQTPVSFKARIPIVEAPRLTSSTPLSGQEIVPEPVLEDLGVPELFSPPGNLTADEATKVNSLTVKQPSLSRVMRLTAPVGDFSAGSQFCFLDYLHEDCLIYGVKIEFSQGACVALTTTYTNGLVVVQGKSDPDSTVFEMSQFENDHFVAGSVEVGTPATGPDKATCVTSIRLYTNRGRSLNATAEDNRYITETSASRDGVVYSDLAMTTWDSPLTSGFIKGFWGRSNQRRNNGRIYRLGFLWGNIVPTDAISVDADEALQYPATSGPVSIDGSSALGAGQTRDIEVAFPSRLPEPPRLLYGINLIVATHHSSCARARLQYSDLTSAGCKFSCISPSGANAFSANYLTLPKTGIHFETGTFDTSVLGRASHTEVVRQYIPFPRRFASPPIVRCWINAFDTTAISFTSGLDRQITVSATQCTSVGFTVAIESLNGYTSASICWLAYDSAEHGKRVQSDQCTITSTNAEKKLTVNHTFSGGPFVKVPAVFLCCNSFHAVKHQYIRWHTELLEVTRERIKFTCGVFENPSSVGDLGFTWIAME